MNSRSNASGDNNRWICPNDRVLTFRAKLDAGWSVRSTSTGSTLQPASSAAVTHSPLSASPYASTSSLSITPSPSCTELGANASGNQVTSSITDEEQAKILSVISRAKRVEQMERERIQRLTDRLQNMKRNSTGNGRDHCALCSEKLKFFSLKASSFDCQQCSKLVCSKCVVDQINPETNTTSFYCKVCSETREIWKKSGAWFLKSLPTFPLIEPPPLHPQASSCMSPSSSSTASFPGNPLQYFSRSESPPSPASSITSFDSSITLSTCSMPMSSAASASGPVRVTRTCEPPASLPASPSTRQKFNLYFNHKPRLK